MRPDAKHASQGVALIEALVAIAIMAFGLLAVAGIQATLRFNADIAKQRSEAVRIAQEELERWRAYEVVATTAGKTAFDDLDDGTNAAVTGSNASFTLSRSVQTYTAPDYKVLTVTVTWADRNGAEQSVRLSSTVARVPPELGATVAVRAYGSPVAEAGGRNGAIPLTATPIGSGQSAFRPPQADNGTVVWRFDNTTALISICSTTAGVGEALTAANVTGCTGRAQLLAGYVRFGPDTSRATAADAQTPNGTAFPVTVTVLQTAPNEANTSCYTEQFSTYVRYYCAVPVSTASNTAPVWSGRAVVGGSSLLTASVTETSDALRRVCRYTPFRDDRTVGPAANQMRNDQHPLDYLNVSGPLANQNFLLVQAGNGAVAPATPVAYDCPENTSEPAYNTWRHPLT